MRKTILIAAALLPLATGGCVARAAWDVATLPVRAGAQVVDWTTTSQSEADRNRGRRIRHQEAERTRPDHAAEKRRRAEAQRRGEQLIDGDLGPGR